jgi:UDP-N-acetylenolpyruvoylglucosamine reductase
MRAYRPQQVLAEPGACATDISKQLMELRARCQRYTGSVVTPMGDEMFYRYQESLINELTTKLAAVLTLAPAGETRGRMSDCEESRRSREQAHDHAQRR